MNVGVLVESSGKTMWLTLDKSSGGSVSITATWLELSDDITKLSEPVSSLFSHNFVWLT